MVIQIEGHLNNSQKKNHWMVLLVPGTGLYFYHLNPLCECVCVWEGKWVYSYQGQALYSIRHQSRFSIAGQVSGKSF